MIMHLLSQMIKNFPALSQMLRKFSCTVSRQTSIKKVKADVSNRTPSKSKDSGTKAGVKPKVPQEEKIGLALDTNSYELLERFKGSVLVGKKYQPVFDFFLELSDVAFKVVADNYVTDGSGTGVVHCAPSFGEDDYHVCSNASIIKKGGDLIVPMDADGCFTEKIVDFKGRYVKDADKDIIAALKAKGRLVSSGGIMHSYPFYWRSDTPFLYRVVPS